MLAQIAVGAKTNEIPLLTKLLDTIDIAGAIITADALHCQRGTAEYITGRGGHYIFTVKDNQRTLRKQLKDLPWKQIPVLDTSIEHGHGRTAKRVLKATEIAEGIAFPGAVQVLQLTRTVTAHKSGKRHTETVYAVTSLSVTDAQPEQIADWLRGHWAIENRLHWVGSAMSPTPRIIRRSEPAADHRSWPHCATPSSACSDSSATPTSPPRCDITPGISNGPSTYC